MAWRSRSGFIEFPPFKYVDDKGNASGPWVEMTEKVAAEAGYQVKWLHLPIVRVHMYLRSGRIDLWPGVADIPALAGHVYESTVTPMRIVLYAFHLKAAESPDSLDFLVGKPLILINGFSYLGALKQLPLRDPDLSYAPTHETAGAFVVSRAHPDAERIVEKLDDAYRRLVEDGQLATLQ